jgi:cell division protein FtsX
MVLVSFPHFKSMLPPTCTLQLQENPRRAAGANVTNIIQIYQGVKKVNYADGEVCWS